MAKVHGLVAIQTDLKSFLDSISSANDLYIDLEGQNSSRNGSISLVIILILPDNIIYAIDVQDLGAEAFDTVGHSGKSLKSILRDGRIDKYFWDVRNDADPLWAHYKVDMNGVTDIQLPENASRRGPKKYLSGLGKIIERDLTFGFTEKQRFSRTKDEVKKLMETNVFANRPWTSRPWNTAQTT